MPRISSLDSVAMTRSICRQWQKRDDIARVAAGLGAHRGFEPGIVAELVDQLRSVGERVAAGDVGCVHAPSINPRPLSRLPTNVVNASFTTLIVARTGEERRCCHGGVMQTPTTHAGGFLLILAIFAGFAGGIATGQLVARQRHRPRRRNLPWPLPSG